MGPDSPLAGRRVIITRSVADNRSLSVTLAHLGATVIELPLVEVRPPVDGGQALLAAVANLNEYRWVVLTSVNGVDALQQALQRAPNDGQWPAGVTVFPVGPVTESAARAAGMAVTAAPETATAESLVAEFPYRSAETGDGASVGTPCFEDGPGSSRRVLAPLAELAGQTVVDGLTAKGYQVDRVTAYRTIAPAAMSASQSQDLAAVDAVMFFSPSVIDRFVAATDALPPSAICVGPSTAGRATERGFPDVVTADPHTEAGVIDAAVRRLGGGNRTVTGRT